jgi:Clp amino terminal domain, pathogenicity island component
VPDAPDPLPVTLDEVITFVGRLHPDADALLQLQDAVIVGERLEELGDDVVGHFVHQARGDGATWSAIGESMGVSKQAAQKRFVLNVGARDDGLLSRFTPRARRVLGSARVEAQRMGAAEVGTAHLLLGLVDESDGLAMRALTDLGVSAESVRVAVAAAAASPLADPPVRPLFAAKSRTVLQVAVEEALHLHHNYVGTEHLLLALLADPDADGTRVLAAMGVTRRKCLSRVKRMLEQIVAERTGA